jgi:hypothetical protein
MTFPFLILEYTKCIIVPQYIKICENDSHCWSIGVKNYGPVNSQTTGKGEK